MTRLPSGLTDRTTPSKQADVAMVPSTKAHENRGAAVDADATLLSRLGYAQELRRRMGAFSNFAIAMSAICVLAGGVTSFHLGFCSVGPAAIGLGWPLVALFSLVVAATLGQVASAFPTAGGLYH
jgi:amino acid transporter